MLDLLIVFTYFIAIVSIGLWSGRGERSLADFALGQRQIPWWAVLFSIIATETSAATFLGMPTEAYVHGNYALLQMAFGMILGRVLVGTVFLQTFYRYQVYSIYEFLEIRFGKKTRKCSSILFLITRVMASGTRLYVEAILLVVLLRVFLGRSLTIPEEIMLYCGSIILVTAPTALYTILGGIKAVIWTDLVQTILMMGCILLCLLLLVARIPYEFRPDLFALKWFDSGIKPGKSMLESLHYIWTSPYTIWTAIIANTFLTMATHGTDQDMVQRMLTAKTAKESRRSVILSGLVDIPILFCFLSIGLLLKYFYQTFPDPSIPIKANEIFPYFIVTQLPSGIRGLLIAGLFATAMGSLSSALNALATCITRDWSHLFSSKPHELKLARHATLFFAILLASVACITATLVIYQPSLRIIPLAVGIFGYTYGSLLGIFLLGLCTSNRGSDSGNLVAMFAGFLGVILIGGLPGFFQGWLLPDLAFPWRIFIGTVISFGIGFLIKK